MTKPRQEFFYKEPNEKRTTKSHEKLKILRGSPFFFTYLYRKW
jgi:hypothetical protein